MSPAKRLKNGVDIWHQSCDIGRHIAMETTIMIHEWMCQVRLPPQVGELNLNSEVGHEIERSCRAPGAVGRVTPCAPRLQPACANFGRRRFLNPLPMADFLILFIPTLVFTKGNDLIS